MTCPESERDRTYNDFNEIEYTYKNKGFQFGYFVYRIDLIKKTSELIMFNDDMYSKWMIKPHCQVIPVQDESCSVRFGGCEVICVLYGDAGEPPKGIVAH